MSATVVKTQAELNAALAASAPHIEIRSPLGVRLQVKGHDPSVTRLDLRGNARADLWGNARAEAGPYAVLFIKPGHAGEAKGKNKIVVPDTAGDAKAWVDLHLAPPKRGRVTVYKAVGATLLSRNGTTYPIGRTVTAPDFRNDDACGHGLHFSPSPSQAGAYHDGPNVRYLECTIAVADLVPLGDDKCKAPRCRVVREVDRWRRAVDTTEVPHGA